MKTLLGLMTAIGCFALTVAEAQDEYVTPLYGYFGLVANSGKYTSQYGEVKTTLLYLDASRLALKKSSYSDFGIPVLGWLISRVPVWYLSGEAKDSDASIPQDEGEISYIYFKYGHRVVDLGGAVIGLGFSTEIKGVNIEEDQLGNPPIGFITASPLLYSRINAGPVAIVPVFEYNILNYAQMHTKDDVKRTGYTLTAHVAFSIGSSLGLTISPMYSVGNYKTSTVPDPNNQMFIPTNWESSNFFIRVGLTKKL